MLIERTENEVIIKLSPDVDTRGLQRIIDYLTFKESTAKSKATQKHVDELAHSIKKGWWSKNKKRLLGA